ncbi:MAG: hypothetical protein RL328_603 [Acidobacteriota bacterium]|jgi:hypothetical protein
MKKLMTAILALGMVMGSSTAFAQGKGGGKGPKGKQTGPQDGSGKGTGKGPQGKQTGPQDGSGKQGKGGPKDGTGPIHTPATN